MAGNGFKYQGTRPWRKARAIPPRTTGPRTRRMKVERNARGRRLAGMSGWALSIERTFDDGATPCAKQATLGPKGVARWGPATLALPWRSPGAQVSQRP